MYTNNLRSIIYIHIKHCRGQDGTLRHPGFHYPWRRHFGFHSNREFPIRKRKELLSLIKLAEKSIFDNLYSKPECHVVSNAFSIYKNTVTVDMSLLKLRVTWSVSLIHCKVVLWRARNPNWPAFSTPMCLWPIFRITFSNSLPVVDKRLIVNFGGIESPHLVSVRL
jgi:hypothetical protein